MRSLKKVFGTTDLQHPLVAEMHRWGNQNISGRLRVLQLAQHFDFKDMRLTPAETRDALSLIGRENVVSVSDPQPVAQDSLGTHQAAIEKVSGVLLLHPFVG